LGARQIIPIIKQETNGQGPDHSTSKQRENIPVSPLRVVQEKHAIDLDAAVVRFSRLAAPDGMILLVAEAQWKFRFQRGVECAWQQKVFAKLKSVHGRSDSDYRALENHCSRLLFARVPPKTKNCTEVDSCFCFFLEVSVTLGSRIKSTPLHSPDIDRKRPQSLRLETVTGTALNSCPYAITSPFIAE
jgi:hypothetical protein